MQTLAVGEIINKIRAQEIFEAMTPDEALHIKVEKYAPVLCTALHSGHRLRSELESKCMLNDYERWYEEDPLTDEFVSEYPLSLRCLDSRYEYDLNRNTEEAVYSVAWGRQVWREPLKEKEREGSMLKYRNFYTIAETIIDQLERIFPKVVVFDIHSYNYKRIERESPVFNLGTEGVDAVRYSREIDMLTGMLEEIKLPEIPVTVRKNDVFQGRGHFTLHITEHFANTLVFPLEIKKVYCDELTGEIYYNICDSLSNQLTRIIRQFADSAL